MTSYFDPTDYGVVEGASADGAANSAALEQLLDLLRSRAKNATANYQGCEIIRFPTGFFAFASTIELTNGTFTIEGVDTGYPAGRGTILKFPAGVTGIRVQRYNTSGASATDGVTHRGGDGAIIRNLSLKGAYSSAEAEAHGIHLRARATIEDFYIEGFEGDGIYSAATAGGATNEGNANNTFLSRGRIQGCRKGISIDGADTNIWSVHGIDCSSNRQWGFFDSSFLGNSYYACHTEANGLITGTTPTVVTHGGNRYGVIVGQELGASTNAPSATATDNAWWYYISAGGVSPGNNINAWSIGTTYRAGGSYLADNNNAYNMFCGCYHESGQGRPQLVYPTLVIGGIMAGSVHGSAGAIGTDTGGYVNTNKGFQVELTSSTSTARFGLGEANIKATILLASDSVVAPSLHRLKYSGKDIRFDYANGDSTVAFWITGPSTANKFGTGAAVPHAFHAPRLMIGDTVANARQITNGTAAPSTGRHGVGEIVFNRAPASGRPMGWVCTASGTPGTWLPLANIP